MKAGEEYQVLGIRKSTKNGRQGTVIYFTTPFEEWEVSGSDSCEGFKTTSEFTYDPSIIPATLKLNDIVTLQYRKGFQNSAVLSGMTIVKSSTK